MPKSSRHKRIEEATMHYRALLGLFCFVSLALFLDGVAADFGGKSLADAAHMAVEDAGGKILGRPIEIVVGDRQNRHGFPSHLHSLRGLR
jgi:hypothetical protein